LLLVPFNPRVRGSIPRGPTPSDQLACTSVAASSKLHDTFRDADVVYLARVIRAKAGRRRTRAPSTVLPSGAMRVRVYARKDPVSGRRHDLVEIVPAGPKAAAQAEAVRTRLLNQVDERRHPRTSATVDQLLDRHFDMAALAPTTLATYVGYATKHIRPLIGQLQVGALDADLFDSFYAELRRCRDHCDRRPRRDHRTTAEHECDTRCRPHRCTR